MSKRSILIGSALLSTLVLRVAPPAATDDTVDVSQLRPGQTQIVAGTGELADPESGETIGDGGNARDALLGDFLEIEAAPDGTIYVMAVGHSVIRVITTDGIITSLKMPPKSIGFNPIDMVISDDGTLFVSYDGAIWKLESDGEFTTIAGGGDTPLKGGAQATDVELSAEHVASSGDTIYFTHRSQIGRIEPDGTITIIAGGGELSVRESEERDAIYANLGDVTDIAADSRGNIYIAAEFGYLDHDDEGYIRKISTDSVISTVVKSVKPGFAGDGGPSTEAQVDLTNGTAIAVDAEDGLLFIDSGNNVIRRVGRDGVIDTIARSLGTHQPGLHSRSLAWAPGADDFVVGPEGNLYLAGPGQVEVTALSDEGLAFDSGEIEDDDEPKRDDDPYADESPGTVLTVAEVESNDNTEPLSGITVAPDGTVYVVGTGDDLGLLAIEADRDIERIAGGTDAHYPFNRIVSDVEHATDGHLYVAAAGAVVRMNPDGSHVTVAGGTGIAQQPAPDGEFATTASLGGGLRLATSPDGTLYIGDPFSRKVHELDEDGRLQTFAENVDPSPGGLAADARGVYVADGASFTVRATDSDGQSSVLIGAKDADSHDVVDSPTDVTVDDDGAHYVSGSDGIRMVDPDGKISTVLKLEDDDDACVTNLDVDAHGNLYFTEAPGHSVRVLVRPGEMSTDEGLSISIIAAAIGVAALAAAAGAIVYRRRRTS
jgi:sugar lactone lactonase YvrE